MRKTWYDTIPSTFINAHETFLNSSTRANLVRVEFMCAIGSITLISCNKFPKIWLYCGCDKEA